MRESKPGQGGLCSGPAAAPQMSHELREEPDGGAGEQAFGPAWAAQGTEEAAAQAQAQLTGQPPWQRGGQVCGTSAGPVRRRAKGRGGAPRAATPGPGGAHLGGPR